MNLLTASTEEKERIASGDMEVLKEVLIRFRLDNIDYLTKLDKDISKQQGAGHLVSDLLAIFQLEVCLNKG